MVTAAEYYTPSGRFSSARLPLAVAGALVAVVALAAAYAYLILYIPLVYIGLLLMGGFGFAIGIITVGALRWAKVRNAQIAAFTAAAVGLVAWYAAWVVWLYAFLRRYAPEDAELNANLWRMAMNPAALWELVLLINETGAWSLRGGEPVTGWFLWAVWFAEAALVLGLAIWIPAKMAGSLPFCENCEVWCRESEDVARLTAADPVQVAQKMEVRNFPYLDSLGLADPEADRWLRVDLHSCPQCAAAHTMSLKSVAIIVNKKGERSEQAKDVVDRLIVSTEEAQQIRGLKERLQPPVATPPAVTA